MKKSFVAMVLILVLCLSQFMIGNAEGKAIDITDTIAIPEWDTSGAYTVETVDGGLKVAGTDTKGEYSCIQGTIEGDVSEYTVIRFVVDGAAGLVIQPKLEANGTEQGFTLEGGEQVIEWVVDDKLVESKLTIFVNPGVAGATDSVIIKSVKICTADYEEPVVEEPSIDDTADINTAPLFAVLVLGLAVVAFASKKRFAR